MIEPHRPFDFGRGPDLPECGGGSAREHVAPTVPKLYRATVDCDRCKDGVSRPRIPWNRPAGRATGVRDGSRPGGPPRVKAVDIIGRILDRLQIDGPQPLREGGHGGGPCWLVPANAVVALVSPGHPARLLVCSGARGAPDHAALREPETWLPVHPSAPGPRIASCRCIAAVAHTVSTPQVLWKRAIKRVAGDGRHHGAVP
mmetsp:Transcript_25724/g.77525  ORF Transcript_25724/g.77525 Transcript_25724/m.77525 type:complete len:201 (+) Transcript_25724:613-1215(+)